MFKVGDRVKVLGCNMPNATITENRGNLGPGGKTVYRVKSDMWETEVCQDQLTFVTNERQRHSITLTVNVEAPADMTVDAIRRALREALEDRDFDFQLISE